MLACERVSEGSLSITEAADMLSISTRQMRRSVRRYEEKGAQGLAHALRGRHSNRAADPELKAAALGRVRERYERFGPTLAAEKLAGEGLVFSDETLRRWMVEDGLWQVNRRRAAHRSSRPRKEHFGELVQMDGSFHDWFEGRRRVCCLMQMVDDATGVRMMLLSEEETTLSALTLLSRWIERHGVPKALYTDRKTVYVSPREPTLEEELAGAAPLSAFGEVCASLGIRIIRAHSPQAKGRVERANGVAQDRLVKELTLENASTLEEGNAVIATGFLDTRFAQEPLSPADFHRRLLPDEDLGRIVRIRVPRTLSGDYTLRHEGRVLQVKKQPGLPLPGKTLAVARCLDGTLRVERDGRELVFEDITETWTRPARPEPAPPERRASHAVTPAPDHPWKKGLPPVRHGYAAALSNSQEIRYSASP